MSPPVTGTLLPGFVGTTLPDWLATRLRAGLGGVCLFGPNIESRPQLRRLTAAIAEANPYAIIALDEEGGDVTRLYADLGSPAPGNAVLGRIDDPDTTREAAAQIGWDLRRAGCTVDFAPCVDLNSRADNPVIGVRSFGDRAPDVARHSAAWVTGLQSSGVAATAKHFPGHGDTSVDSHLALPVVDRSLAELRERELIPFAAAIDAGARLVMTSHLLLPRLDAERPATMSRAVLGEVLRKELGFSGVVVSDALDMAGAQAGGGLAYAAVRALRAGCDLLCLGTANTDAELDEIERAVAAALADGTLDADRVQQATDRVRGLAVDLAELRTAIPVPSSQPPEISLAAVSRAFDRSPTARSWGFGTAATVVRLEAQPNQATGSTPWGPFAPGLGVWAAVTVTPEDAGLPALARSAPVLVVGRDIHRHTFARAAVDQLRADHDHVLVIDMGWPSVDRRYADVATFGSSPLIGRALLAQLAAGLRAP